MSDIEWEIHQIHMAIAYHEKYNPHRRSLKFRGAIYRLRELVRKKVQSWLLTQT